MEDRSMVEYDEKGIGIGIGIMNMNMIGIIEK